tara:strand:- start:394 stop:1005 length:612 start_codon:yes stop_codon:yes gene_type:complete
MQNYLSGFFISFLFHIGLVLSFTNFFQIKDLYAINQIDPIPAYLIFESPKADQKKIKPRTAKEVIINDPLIRPKTIEIANPKSEIESIDLERRHVIDGLKKNDIDSTFEQISYYSNLIKTQIMANWKQPTGITQGISVEISLTLVPTGEVIQVQMIKTSGSLAFDNSALNAVEKVSRFYDLDMDRKLFDDHFRKFTLVFNPKD